MKVLAFYYEYSNILDNIEKLNLNKHKLNLMHCFDEHYRQELFVEN